LDRSEIQAKIWETYESGELIRACAWCTRLCLDGEWVLADRDALRSIDALVTLSHGICPSCAQTPEPPTQLAESLVRG
jgi:hypothetical protein